MASREEQLEREFLQAALKRSELIRRKEPKRANREYDRVYRLKTLMRRLPDRGQAALKRIAAAADDDEVKILTAAALLAIDEDFAAGLLEQIQRRGGGIPSFTAEMTLKEWRSGAIKEYWS